MTHGAGYCPRLRRPADEDDLVPSGVARELVLEAENLPHPQAGHAGFQCLVDIEGAKMAIGARIEAGRYVVCDKTTVYFHQLIIQSISPDPLVFLTPSSSAVSECSPHQRLSLMTSDCIGCENTRRRDWDRCAWISKTGSTSSSYLHSLSSFAFHHCSILTKPTLANTKPRCRSSGTGIITSAPCPSLCTSAISSDLTATTPTAPSALPEPRNTDAPGAGPSAPTAKPVRSAPRLNALDLVSMWYVHCFFFLFVNPMAVILMACHAGRSETCYPILTE